VISHSHKCIFVHIPKCGGSSLEAVIWPGERTESDLWMGFVDPYHNKYQTGGLQHLHADQILTEVGESVFRSYFKFAFVRNPFEKAVSQFGYMQTRPDLRDFVGMNENDSFSRYLDLISSRTHVQWEPQSNFLFDAKESCLVDFVGRFETFSADARSVLDRLNLPQEVPHLNRGEHRDYVTYYNERDVAVVEGLYARDLLAFDYRFEY
jgi:hypothetical protein